MASFPKEGIPRGRSIGAPELRNEAIFACAIRRAVGPASCTSAAAIPAQTGGFAKTEANCASAMEVHI
jgi:hypothetical protein